ncbi:MAG: penicillin-binding protein 2 [Armatimonadota bacterium]
MAHTYKQSIKNRTLFVFIIFTIAYLLIFAKLVQYQILDRDMLIAKGGNVKLSTLPLPADRGGVFDRNGVALSVNVDSVTVFADPSMIDDPKKSAEQVAKLFGGVPEDYIDGLSNKKSKYYRIARKVDLSYEEIVSKNKKEMPWLFVENESRRERPAKTLASQIIGFTDIDGKGLSGIELSYNKELAGQPGILKAELDRARRPIPGTRQIDKEPINGSNIYLTIDSGIQYIAEEALKNMADVYKPDSAVAIVMNPQTGEVLAIANYPFFNPEKITKNDKDILRNRAVTDRYEPGSTMKVLTVAAGLSEGIKPREKITVCTGVDNIGNSRYRCHLTNKWASGHGSVDCYSIIENSCNIGAAHIGFRIGSEKIYEYYKAFGILDDPWDASGYQVSGSLEDFNKWSKIKLANVCFGQGISCTPMHVASIYCAIANGGTYIKPQIIREIRDSKHDIVKPFEVKESHRVIKAEIAKELTKMMMSCVENGTGKNADTEDWYVAGKTGSSQMARKDARGYEPGAFIASFYGFAPATDPKIVIGVVVTKPKGSHYGGSVAAPVFKEIAEKALWQMEIPADKPGKINIPKNKKDADKKKLV